MAGKKIPPEKRFWKKVKKTGPIIRPDLGPCWLWTGCRSKRGYGFFRTTSQVMAHRASYEIAYGPVQETVSILHRCDNPPCVNPQHLRQGTQADNVKDMWDKGRQNNNFCNHRARLTPENVTYIRQAVASQSESKKALARKFGVDPSAIRNVVNRRSWRHIP